MSHNRKSLMRQLRNVCLVIRHQAEQTEAKVQQANALLHELKRNRVVQETVVVGPVLFIRRDAQTPDGSDTSQVVQAVLCMENGIGAAFWDSDLYTELSSVFGGLESEVGCAFVPFERCEPSVRAALLPHIESLVGKLWQRMREARQAVRSRRCSTVPFTIKPE